MHNARRVEITAIGQGPTMISAGPMSSVDRNHLLAHASAINIKSASGVLGKGSDGVMVQPELERRRSPLVRIRISGGDFKALGSSIR
jgi:hypothetical protein